jgi:hypothetical protein
MNLTEVRLRPKHFLFMVLASCVMACSHGSPTPTQVVYASLPDQHMLAIFAGTAVAATPLATIKEAPADIPIDVGIDLLGEVFVANQNGNIKVYAGRNYDYQVIRGLAGLHTQLQHLNAFAVDHAGGLYVADSDSGSGDAKILVFAPNMTGDIPPDHSISGPHTGLTTPTGISIDATGRTFVADRASNKILIFEAGTRGDTPPIATINSVPAPNRVYVDQELNLYVDSGSDHSITVFIPEGPDNWSRTATITSSDLQNPQGIAVDANGRVAAAIQGRIAFFAANADGPSAPVQLLQVPPPFNPVGIAIR